MIRYYITDRTQLRAGTLLENIARRMAEGIELIQLRERDLPASELYVLLQAVRQLPNPHGTKILVNDRIDVALTTGAAGVHLRGKSVAPSRIRATAPDDFLIGVSCHTVEEVRRAADEGASFAVLAPIYATPGQGSPLGLEQLRQASRVARIPVLALGGVTAQRTQECLDAGAAGIAGISLFQKAS
jgi:thiamine-phosphate pyrophosphorylase